MDFPVVKTLALDQKVIVEYVSEDVQYICTAESPNTSKNDYKWQIKKIENTATRKPIVLFANGSAEYIFKQTDFNNALVITYTDN